MALRLLSTSVGDQCRNASAVSVYRLSLSRLLKRPTDRTEIKAPADFRRGYPQGGSDISRRLNQNGRC